MASVCVRILDWDITVEGTDDEAEARQMAFGYIADHEDPPPEPVTISASEEDHGPSR